MAASSATAAIRCAKRPSLSICPVKTASVRDAGWDNLADALPAKLRVSGLESAGFGRPLARRLIPTHGGERTATVGPAAARRVEDLHDFDGRAPRHQGALVNALPHAPHSLRGLVDEPVTGPRCVDCLWLTAATMQGEGRR